MTPEQRAESVFDISFRRLLGDKVFYELIDLIAAQIAEAEREAVKAFIKHIEGQSIEFPNILKAAKIIAHEDGFRAAREKAAGMFEKCDTQEFGAVADMEAIAERIRAMVDSPQGGVNRD